MDERWSLKTHLSGLWKLELEVAALPVAIQVQAQIEGKLNEVSLTVGCWVFRQSLHRCEFLVQILHEWN